ncbi:BrnA antitoxin family protein [Limnohabitans sp.]|nr:BrnA antitoxin family protein [Limnohabitans sp.]
MRLIIPLRDVVTQFRPTGAGWQTRMNAALRQFIEEHPLAH